MASRHSSNIATHLVIHIVPIAKGEADNRRIYLEAKRVFESKAKTLRGRVVDRRALVSETGTVFPPEKVHVEKERRAH